MTTRRVPAGTPTGGRFALVGRTESEVELAAPDTSGDAPVQAYWCDTPTDLRKALATIRRTRPAQASIEIRTRAGSRTRWSNMPDIRPPSGTVLFMDVTSGFATLNITEGRVVCRPRSRWGNPINVSGPAEVHLDMPDLADQPKVSVVVCEGPKGVLPTITMNSAGLHENSRLTVWNRGVDVDVQVVDVDQDTGAPATWVTLVED